MTTFRELYESRVAEFGEEDHLTIRAGMEYAKELLNAGRGDESWELLFKLLATSKQVLEHHKGGCLGAEMEQGYFLYFKNPLCLHTDWSVGFWIVSHPPPLWKNLTADFTMFF